MKSTMALFVLLFTSTAFAELTIDSCNYPRVEGTVVRYSADKGYGFVKPEGLSLEVLVHINAVEAAGWSTLIPDQCVSFEIISGRDGREMAACLQECR